MGVLVGGSCEGSNGGVGSVVAVLVGSTSVGEGTGGSVGWTAATVDVGMAATGSGESVSSEEVDDVVQDVAMRMKRIKMA